METPPDRSPLTEGELNFVAHLRMLRTRQGLSQEALAEKMHELGFDGFNQMTISRLEKGARPVRLSEARALAYLLDTSTEQMSAPTDQVRAISGIISAADQIEGLIQRVAELKIDILDYVTFGKHALIQYQEAVDESNLTISPQMRGRVRESRERIERFVNGGYQDFMSSVDEQMSRQFGIDPDGDSEA